MVTDMTEGAPGKLLWRFSIPLLLSVMFQQCYSIVDSVVAGRFVSKEALAAVGLSYPVTMIFMAFATGCNIGCSVVISQLFGAKDYEKLKTAVSTSLIAVLGLSAILTVGGLFACTPLMRLLNTPQEIFTDSALYLRVYICGLAFLFLYNICTGIFTALGDSKTPLYFLIFSSLGNIALDLWFVIGFHMGVAGVAWATFTAQGVSSVLAVLALFIRLRGMVTVNSFRLFSGRMLARLSLISIPSILQQSLISVGNLCVQGLINSYGPTVIAGYSGAVKLNTFAITSFTTLGNGLSCYTAQNIGGLRPDRVRLGFHHGLRMILCIVAPVFAIYFFLGGPVMGLFIDLSEVGVVEVGTTFLRIVSPFYFVIAVKLVADGVLRGAGAMLPFMISTFSDLIIRVVLSFVLADMLQSSTGIWLSWPVGWVLGSALSLLFYLLGFWKKKLPAANGTSA